MLLKNRVAIVTGAAGGMGKAISLRFAAEGCDIVAADINIAGTDGTINEVKKLGRDGLSLQANITKSDQVKNMVEKTIEKFGRIDILVNSAGTLFAFTDENDLGKKRSIGSISEDEWDKLVEVNLKGCFLCCKYAAPYMMEKRYGKIINFSTSGAVNPPAVAPHYNSAKAGVLGLTYDMACELGPYNINVNAILPGPIRTSFYDKIVGSLSEEEKNVRFTMMCKNAPLQRIGTPEDIAGVALFFASELSSYVTGVPLLVSGGIPLMPRL